MEAKDFSALRISLASPEQIREWSYGEVTKPETINYRRLRPEKDGLFCEAIFGPTRDWQCYCGKYKNVRYKGLVCDKCGVEVTRSAVRRERMGHIELAAPVAHVWYTRRVPSYLGLLLDISRRNLDRVLYFAQHVITKVDEDARNRAVGRIQKELQHKEKELGGDIHERMAEIRGSHDGFVGQYEARVNEINEHAESELTRLSDEAVREGQSIQTRLGNMTGSNATSDVNFESAGQVIVARGEQVTRDHLQRVQDITNRHLSDLQATLEQVRQEEIGKLNQEFEGVATEVQSTLTEQTDQLDQRLQKIRESAQRQIEELKELKVLQFLPDNRFRELKSKYGNVFQGDMGAEAFYEILKGLNLEKMSEELWKDVRTTKSKQRKKKATKRLRVVESLRASTNSPEWMILTVLPVIPPDLRPMVQLDGGRFATSDLNDLYRRVINRNNRLKHLLELGAPDVIVRNEKRMLQEAVDSLIDNSQRGKALSRRGRRELKSLSDMLKGKKGRFRRNLLGKRVDYSGRSVIVIGPRLKLHQCGLPKTMALELYRPFVISRLVKYNYASNVKGAKRIIEREKPEVWEVLEQVIKDRPVLLNRAPTLHRLGIQAFEPQLVEGKAIQIHPLVCSAFNADFDGDQMAVHVPLSDKAVNEARTLMLSTKNLLKPADGQPIVGPAKDMVLGIYYLTMDPTVEIVSLKERAGEFRTFSTLEKPEVRVGVALRTNGFYWAQYRDIPGKVIFEDTTVIENDRARVTENALDRMMRALFEGEIDCVLVNTIEMRKLMKKKGWTEKLEVSNLHERRLVVDMDEVEYIYNLGQVELHTPILLGNYNDDSDAQPGARTNNCWSRHLQSYSPDEVRFVQETLDKKKLQKLVSQCYAKLGSDITTDIVDAIKDYGFRYATVSGTTIAVSDLIIPDERAGILEHAEEAVTAAERNFRRGLLTEEERYQITIEEWTKAKDQLQDVLQRTLNPYGPIAVMAISGSTKGGFGPITQLAGMRGLMADPSGRIIDLPIRSHFREGLNALEYFISTHGARKGLADTALRTADAGYLTRRLVDVAQDMIINRTDCGTEKGLIILRRDDVAGQTIQERIVGRCSTREIIDPKTGDVIVPRNGMIDDEVADAIDATGMMEVEVRSPMTCSLVHGCCALCYGRDLGTGDMVQIGTAVGVIAAQSIGEPGTQLTLRTFHTGGTAAAGGDITSGLPRVEELFEGRKKPKGESVMVDIDGILRLRKREDNVQVATVINSSVESQQYDVPENWSLLAHEDDEVKKGTMLAQRVGGGDDEKLVSEMPGKVHVEGHTIYIRYEKREEIEYEIPASSRLRNIISDGMQITAGTQLTEGSLNPHQILKVLGAGATQLYLLTEIQKVYRSQGVNIADKHFEVVIRKMLSKVQITRSGDTDLLPGELIDQLQLLELNEELRMQNKELAAAMPVLLGVTKAALSTDSFLSAASFQHTIKVLAGAAIEGKIDPLYGLKENVIIGKLIPSGTGFHAHKDRERIGPRTSLRDQGALDVTEEDYDEADELYE